MRHEEGLPERAGERRGLRRGFGGVLQHGGAAEEPDGAGDGDCEPDVVHDEGCGVAVFDAGVHEEAVGLRRDLHAAWVAEEPRGEGGAGDGRGIGAEGVRGVGNGAVGRELPPVDSVCRRAEHEVRAV